MVANMWCNIVRHEVPETPPKINGKNMLFFSLDVRVVTVVETKWKHILEL